MFRPGNCPDHGREFTRQVEGSPYWECRFEWFEPDPDPEHKPPIDLSKVTEPISLGIRKRCTFRGVIIPPWKGD